MNIKEYTLLFGSLGAMLWSPFAYADCRAPDILTVELRRSGSGVPTTNDEYDVVLSIGVRWNADGALQEESGGEVHGCDEDEAWELEAIIQTVPQKCFAQPIGGYDSYERPEGASSTLPRWYADIWNYEWPEDVAGDIVGVECSIWYPDFFQEVGNAWDKKLEVSDKIANFAIGTKNSKLLTTDFSYEFTYPLELPEDEDCWTPKNVDQADEAYVRVNMHEVPNTCTLYTGWAIEQAMNPPMVPILDFSKECAHLLGFGGCSEMAGPNIKSFFDIDEHETLATRICGPTEEVVFDFPWVPASHYVAAPGGTCEDLDNDGLFGVKEPRRVWGSLARDCNDNPVHGAQVLDEGYSSESGSCGASYDCDVGEFCDLGFFPGYCSDEGEACNTTCGKCYEYTDTEDCEDWLDNDGDDFVDCQDPDCADADECCLDPGFFDVAPMDWYYPYIRKLVCEGVLDNDVIFYHPQDGANRAEFLKINLLLAYPNANFDNYVDDALVYPDVSVDDWFAPYVGFATHYNIVEGYPDNTFKPENTINRAEAADISVKMYKGWVADLNPRYNELGTNYLALRNAGQYDGQEYPDVTWLDPNDQNLSCADEQDFDPPYSEDCWYYHPVYALRDFDGAACGKSVNNQVLYDPGAPVTRAETAKIACIVSGVCGPEECAQ